MLSVLSLCWDWMPSPLADICYVVCMSFFVFVFAKLLKLVSDFISQVIGIIKTLLISWGVIA